MSIDPFCLTQKGKLEKVFDEKFNRRKIKVKGEKKKKAK